jgi:hypothetical protein
MSKLSVKLQQIFADIGATGPSGEYYITQFGSLKAGSPLATIDPATIQALSAYGYGFSSAIINGGAPAIQDIDGLCRMLSIGVAYLQQAGIAEYNSSDEYKVGSFVSSTNGAIYRSVAASNTGNALSDTTKWMLYKSNMVGAYTEYFGEVVYNENCLHFTGTETGNTVVLPAIGTHNKGRVIRILNASSQTIVLAPTGTDVVDIYASINLTTNKAMTLCSNGVSKWDIIGVIAIA